MNLDYYFVTPNQNSYMILSLNIAKTYKKKILRVTQSLVSVDEGKSNSMRHSCNS